MSVPFEHDEWYAEYIRDCQDAEQELHDRRLDVRDRYLPLPQMSPQAALVERYGMSARDPELPKAA